MEKFHQVPCYHTYSIGHIHLFLSLVLTSSTGLRAASRVIEMIASFFKLPLSVPSWYTGRLWLLRLGYYKLTRTKQKAADWIWIIDHTIQWGSEKCLVRLKKRNKNGMKFSGCLNEYFHHLSQVLNEQGIYGFSHLPNFHPFRSSIL